MTEAQTHLHNYEQSIRADERERMLAMIIETLALGKRPKNGNGNSTAPAHFTIAHHVAKPHTNGKVKKEHVSTVTLDPAIVEDISAYLTNNKDSWFSVHALTKNTNVRNAKQVSAALKVLIKEEKVESHGVRRGKTYRAA